MNQSTALARSRNDRMIAGVIGGIAHRLGWSSTWLRVIFVVGDVAWPTAVNVGTPRSFEVEPHAMLEASLLGFSGDLYGDVAEVVFVRFLRAPQRLCTLIIRPKEFPGVPLW